MTKVKIEVEIPDGNFCNPENPRNLICPFWWVSDDGEVGCNYSGKSALLKGNECSKLPGCPNPE